jgi:hypothetical protein
MLKIGDKPQKEIISLFICPCNMVQFLKRRASRVAGSEQFMRAYEVEKGRTMSRVYLIPVAVRGICDERLWVLWSSGRLRKC